MHKIHFALMFLMTGCPMDKQQEHVLDDKAPIQTYANDSIPNVSWSEVSIDTEKAAFNVSEENLFGKFYQDRVEFHIIDDPDLQLHQAQVKKITLYYIDGILCRKKYLLDQGIANQLAARYGALTYRSLNFETDSLAKEMGVLIASATGKRFNPYLKKYQLKWKLDDSIIYFQHLEDSINTYNYYIEEIAEYQKRYRSVQKDLL